MFRKVKKVMIESPEYEEEEEYEEEDESDGYGWGEKIIEKDEFERKEKRDKLIRSCKCYSYLRDSPNLFTKEERKKLLDPFIEDLSEENFQRLLNKYKMFATQLKLKQINEDIEAMTSSIIETQECILMEKIYDHIYFKLEKDKIKKELLEKENKEKERIIKIKQKWDEVFTLDHKFYFNKRSWETFRKQKPIILHKFKWIKLMKALNGKLFTNMKE
jgi:hypothetical protein